MKHFYYIWFISFFGKVVCEKSDVKWKILVLGGNGFIGSECVHMLLQKNHELVLLNRGMNYWDSDSHIKPFVKNINCDRYQGLNNCKTLSKMLNEIEKFDFVIDFSGYDPEIVQDTLDFIQGKVRVYVYISTDSVYEVCDKQHSQQSEETDTQWTLPKHEQVIQDHYGSRKLACEQSIQDHKAHDNFSYVIFRLPDVIGPRDTTYRWWTYQFWIQLHNMTGQVVFIPQNIANTYSSLVYVKDVAQILLNTLEQISRGGTNLLDQVFNLAFNETFTLKKILYTIQKILGIHGVQYAYKKNAFHLYPSVYNGPINISKAKKMLQWNPTPWHQAAQETVTFYKQALYKFRSEGDRVIHKLLNHVVLPLYQENFLNAVQQLIHNNDNGNQELLPLDGRMSHNEL